MVYSRPEVRKPAWPVYGPGRTRPGGHATMSPYDDDDDWVGTPPEGHYTRDRAKPEFWWRQKPIVPAFVGIFVVVVVIVVVVLLG
jgi:hypothetical protein